ncbi:MAG: hypothetical protein JO147_01560, partial [Actinobacteria bacterium]|nr:hypothetical protein [Actinomycetota bacterium]
DDLGFIRTLTQQFEAAVPTSTAYLIGFSNGAKMAFSVMCNEPELFAAFAAIEGPPTSTCTTAVPKPVLVGVGAQDDALLGKSDLRPAQDVLDSIIATWRARDQCETPAPTQVLGTATVTTWSCNAPAGSEVVAAIWSQLAHDWPIGSQVGGAAAAGATLIWALFTRAAPPPPN